MLRVEFEYNPYTMKYNVSFNGVRPHINSLLEEYSQTP